jgi:putative membrane protein
MFHDMGDFGWGMGFGWILMILFWALVILGVVGLFKWSTGRSGTRSKTAREVLQERYARGEIDQQEYQEKMLDLDK